MTTQGQRVWSRVEAPGTARGHALVARFGGKRWTAWENADGTWNLRYGDGDPVLYPDWSGARGAAETSKTRPPRLPNPLNPHVANAAAMGTAFALRARPLPNPRIVGADRHAQVCRAMEPGSLSRPCTLLASGTVRVHVPRGRGAAAAQRLGRAALDFDVEVVET